MDHFRDRVAFVTGGGSGIGRGLSMELASRGARVIVADIDAVSARKTAAAIRERGGFANDVTLDVTDPGSVRFTVERAAEEFGRLDYMFNNAGIGLNGSFEDIEPPHWKHILDVNLYGVIHGSLYAYRVMVRQGFGHIVNIASLAGLVPMTGSPYHTAKHGVVGLTLSLRMEAAIKGVRASVVCPGMVDTPIFDRTIDVSNQFFAEDIEEFYSRFKFVSPEECARTILKGVCKNRAIIVVTPLARIMWGLYRLFPGLFIRISISQTRKFYEKYARKKTPSGGEAA
ncbi:MAG: SDR family NAD(P)-dependent oxidoreductase [Spirochaetes bacterium]|nr:SDR family NAD(P)-dependent oxidoreductase [Spirochaetota bacterium]